MSVVILVIVAVVVGVDVVVVGVAFGVGGVVSVGVVGGGVAVVCGLLLWW